MNTRVPAGHGSPRLGQTAVKALPAGNTGNVFWKCAGAPDPTRLAEACGAWPAARKVQGANFDASDGARVGASSRLHQTCSVRSSRSRPSHRTLSSAPYGELHITVPMVTGAGEGPSGPGARRTFVPACGNMFEHTARPGPACRHENA